MSCEVRRQSTRERGETLPRNELSAVLPEIVRTNSDNKGEGREEQEKKKQKEMEGDGDDDEEEKAKNEVKEMKNQRNKTKKEKERKQTCAFFSPMKHDVNPDQNSANGID